jgi:hypothetical protein
MLTATACGSDPLGSETTTVHDRKVFIAEAPTCDDDNSCERSFYVDGRQYRPCADISVEPSQLGVTVAVGGESTPDIREVKRLGDLPVDTAVAALTTCGAVEGWFRATAVDP